jgi:adenine-specific DNA-methyltransferase
VAYGDEVSTPTVHALSAGRRLDELTRDELIELLEARGEGGIRIDFSGKSNARKLARRVRPRIAQPIKKYSVGDEAEQSRNLVLEGDNLQAMATLFRERGQVDLILTDPPYNTGNDWRYNDRWEDDPNDPGLGDWVSRDDGARHTKWMRFMWPRLQMMKSMLRPSGVLAICIDHRELFRLGQMLDELFPGGRLAIINWQRAASRRNDKGGKAGQGGVSTSTEYILVYAKDREKARTGLEERTTEAGYRNPTMTGGLMGRRDPVRTRRRNAPRHGLRRSEPLTGLLHYPSGTGCWKSEKAWIKAQLERWGSKYEERDLNDGKAKALLLEGAEDPRERDPATDPVVKAARQAAEGALEGVLPELFFTKRGYGRPRKKTYLAKIKAGKVPTTYWADDDYASRWSSKRSAGATASLGRRRWGRVS